MASRERHLLCLYQVAVTSWVLSDSGDSHAAVERGMKGRSVPLEGVHNLLTWEKAIWIVVLVRKARKLGHPVRRVEGERIPPPIRTNLRPTRQPPVRAVGLSWVVSCVCSCDSLSACAG